MTEHIPGFEREQAMLLPDALEQYVDEDNEVRFIDAFVESLDLKELGFERVEPSETGRPSYDPNDLLKLYVWGYLNRTRSSRKLEKECHRNLELIWLMKKLAPDFKTIADFRKENVDCVKKVFKEFVSFLQDIDLVEGKLASLDGSKIKACNASKRNFNAEYLASKLKRIEERVERYLKELEQNDELDDVNDEDNEDRELLKKRNECLRAKLEKLKKSKGELEEIGRKMEESGKSELSLTDPDSREMRNNGKIEICYNSELSVDSKEKMIVNYDVTNEPTDERQLAPMAKSTKEILGVDKFDVTADTGFANMVQIKECVDNGITPYLPATKLDGSRMGRPRPDPLFGKEKFVYDPDRDVYICPAGKEHTFRFTITTRIGKKRQKIYRTAACATCPFRARCTSNKRGRTVERWEHQEIIDQVIKRSRLEPEKQQERMKLAEHPFGTIKRAFNMGYFLLKGLRKVNAEMGLAVIAYDMRRALNILGTRGLLDALMVFAGGTGSAIRLTK